MNIIPPPEPSTEERAISSSKNRTLLARLYAVLEIPENSLASNVLIAKYLDCSESYVRRNRPSKPTVVIASNGISMNTSKIGAAKRETNDPNSLCQKLMDDLWDAGIRPTWMKWHL